MLDSRRDPFHRVVYRVDFYLSRHKDKDKGTRKENRKIEKERGSIVEKKEVEKRRRTEREREKRIARRNKFHFPAPVYRFQALSLSVCIRRESSDFRSILQTRWSTDTENREPRSSGSSGLLVPGPFFLDNGKEREAGRLVAKGFRKRSKRRRLGKEGVGGGRGRRKEISPRNRGEPRCRGSGGGRGRGEGNGSSSWTRRLDAGFFQRGHGRMDVGIMEASTVPSLPDKNCRWKEDGDEGDEGRIREGKEERRRESGKRKAKRREIERVGKGERRREKATARPPRSLERLGTRDEEFRYALSSTVGRIKISSRRWRRYTVLEPLPFCAREKRERPPSTATTPPRSQNSLTETRISASCFLQGNISEKVQKFQFQKNLSIAYRVILDDRDVI